MLAAGSERVCCKIELYFFVFTYTTSTQTKPNQTMSEYPLSLYEYSNEMAIAIQSNFRNSIHMSNVRRNGFLDRDLLWPKIDDTHILDELERFIPLLLKKRGRDTIIANFQKLKGQTVLLQYPDSSSWSTHMHLEFFEISDVDIDNNRIIFKIPVGDRRCTYEKYGGNLLSYTTFSDFVYMDSYQVWVPPSMYLKAFDLYQGPKVNSDELFLMYKFSTEVITDCRLADDLFTSDLYDSTMDFVKTP